MNKNLTELVFILDKSGSMQGLEKDTIGGFNSMLKKQKEEEGVALVTTILFDHKVVTLHDRLDVKEINLLTSKDYVVGGSTALLDAVGNTMEHIMDIHKYIREEDRPAKTLFVITTDGFENASMKHSYASVKRLIDQIKEKENAEFIFLGANIDTMEVAGKMGISREFAVDYECDEKGTELNYSVLSKTISKVRRAMPEAMVGASIAAFREEIDEDYRRRHK